MRNAEQAGLPTGWSRKESCEAGSRRRRGSGWTPAPVAAQSAPSPAEIAPAEVADHLTALLAVGWTLPLLERETGLARESLRRLHAGTNIDAAAAAIAVDFGFGCRPGQTLAPSLGAWRRTQALTAMGWSLERQAVELAVSPMVLDELRHTTLIDGRLWLAIDVLYDRWAMTPGPDTSVMEQARVGGVTPPLGWDDDELDHPSARSLAEARNRRAIVDQAAVERRCGGDITVAICPGERAEITRIAVDEQWPAARLALVLDIDEESARRTLRRWRAADREDEVVAPETAPETSAVETSPAEVDSLESLSGPTDTELDALGQEGPVETGWMDLAELDSTPERLQLELGLVVHPRARRWRRPPPGGVAGSAGGGGGDPGNGEQLALEVALLRGSAA